MTNSPRRSPFDSFISKLMPIVIIVGTVSTGLALLSYVVLGFFSRYYADDYCMSGLVFQKGFWQAQIDQYMGWSNRYAGMFTLSLSDLLGHSAIKFWTAFAIILLVLALLWMLAQLNKWLNLSFSKWLLVLLAELVLFFTLLFAPQLYQSLFWRVGLITYTLPLAFLSFLVGLVVRFSAQAAPGVIKRGEWVVCFMIALFAGGFSETYLVLQISVFLLGLMAALLLVRAASRRNWISMFAAVLIGSMLSLAIVLASPGNAVRQAAMPPPPDLLSWIRMVVLHAFLFIYRLLAANPFQVLLAVLIPTLLVYGHYASKSMSHWRPSLLISMLLLTPVVGFVLISAVMAPAAFVQSSYPDDRVLVEAGFLAAVFLIILGILAGVIFSQLHQWAGEGVPSYLESLVALLAIIFLLYPLYDIRKNIFLLPEFQARAVSWDARDVRIRAARQRGIFDIQEVANNAPANLTDLKSDHNDWINTCATWFYDINSISANNP